MSQYSPPKKSRKKIPKGGETLPTREKYNCPKVLVPMYCPRYSIPPPSSSKKKEKNKLPLRSWKKVKKIRQAVSKSRCCLTYKYVGLGRNCFFEREETSMCYRIQKQVLWKRFSLSLQRKEVEFAYLSTEA